MDIFPRILPRKVRLVFDEGEPEGLVPAKLMLIVSVNLMPLSLTFFIIIIYFC